MSPRSVRRFRAERMLRDEFAAMRAGVLGAVRARLRTAGVSLDPGDLEACYSQAWHGLYTTMLEGEVEVANPAGWLVLVTYRRAIDEHRHRARSQAGAREELDGGGDVEGAQPDLAQELDDRVRLRQLVEGLRGRLGSRERQAAALCYLHGLSRSEAAARMGISAKRMRKLMDGDGRGSPGVAAKFGQLLETIRAGEFCAEQASLMRGLAFGILDPDGERYALAQAHHRSCPACRSYVLSLRGLASVLPLPALPLLGAGAAGAAGGGLAAARSAVGGGSAAGSGSLAGAGVAGAGAAGAGTAGGLVGVSAGGGWLFAGAGLSVKLAAGCLFALGLSAGCLALGGASHSARHPAHERPLQRTATRRAAAYVEASSAALASVPASTYPKSSATHAGVASTSLSVAELSSAARASREFGPEQALRADDAQGRDTAAAHDASRAGAPRRSGAQGGDAQSHASRSGGPSAAEISAAESAGGESAGESSSGESSAGQSSGETAPSSTRSSRSGASGSRSAAAREFGVG